MAIDPPHAVTPKCTTLYQVQHVTMKSDARAWQRFKISQDLAAISKGSASEFSDYEWMREDRAFLEESFEPRIAYSEVVDPNGGIDERHRFVRNGLRRGMACA